MAAGAGRAMGAIGLVVAGGARETGFMVRNGASPSVGIGMGMGVGAIVGAGCGR